jgi:hypothetical protein
LQPRIQLQLQAQLRKGQQQQLAQGVGMFTRQAIPLIVLVPLQETTVLRWGV